MQHASYMYISVLSTGCRACTLLLPINLPNNILVLWHLKMGQTKAVDLSNKGLNDKLEACINHKTELLSELETIKRWRRENCNILSRERNIIWVGAFWELYLFSCTTAQLKASFNESKWILFLISVLYCTCFRFYTNWNFHDLYLKKEWFQKDKVNLWKSGHKITGFIYIFDKYKCTWEDQITRKDLISFVSSKTYTSSTSSILLLEDHWI